MELNFTNSSDEFFINMDLHTALPLPRQRENVLQFSEIVQKQFPIMSEFYQRETGEYVLESDRTAGTYQWMELSKKRLSSGVFNPLQVDDAYQQHTWILDRSRYFLGVSHLDVESLDLLYGFNLEYMGNRDALVHDSLLEGSLLGAVADLSDGIVLNFEPILIFAIEDDCSLQARLAIETHNNIYQIRSDDYTDDPISIYFTLRAHRRPGEKFDPVKSLKHQAKIGEDLLARIVIPRIVRPIALAIAADQ